MKTIPTKITHIPDYAFAFGYFDELEFHDNIISIGSHAFAYSYIKSVILPDACTSLGERAFFYTNISEIRFGQNLNSIGVGCFSNAFLYCGVDIPASLKSINESAFEDCCHLGNITFNEGLETIGKLAFSIQLWIWYRFNHFTSQEIIFLKSLYYIGEKAFHHNVNIYKITFKCTNLTIGESAFAYVCFKSENYPAEDVITVDLYKGYGYQRYFNSIISNRNFSEVLFNHSYEHNDKLIFKNSAFYYSEMKMKLPENLVYIGEKCFSYSLFPEIYIPNSVEIIGREAFSYSSSYQITLSPLSNLKNRETNIFKCSNIRTFKLPDVFTNITGALFMGCKNMISVEIPNVTSIEKYAFYNCISLSNFIIPDGCKYLAEFSFAGSGLVTIYIPKSITFIGESSFEGCNKLKYINISKTLTLIPTKAFSRCENLLEINASSVSSIGPYAFQNCQKLETITFSKNLKYLKEFCFYNCKSLCTVTIEPNCYVNESAFSGCTGIKNVILKSNCTIDQNAFANCALENVFMYENVTTKFNSFNRYSIPSDMLHCQPPNIDLDTCDPYESYACYRLKNPDCDPNYDGMCYDYYFEEFCNPYYDKGCYKFEDPKYDPTKDPECDPNIYKFWIHYFGNKQPESSINEERISNVSVLSSYSEQKFFSFTPIRTSNVTMSKLIKQKPNGISSQCAIIDRKILIPKNVIITKNYRIHGIETFKSIFLYKILN